MTSQINLVSYEFETGIRDKWLACFAEFAPAMRAEPGNLALFAIPDPDSSGGVHVVESYRDEACFQAHLSTPHLAAFKEALRSGGLAPTRATVHRYEAIERS